MKTLTNLLNKKILNSYLQNKGAYFTLFVNFKYRKTSKIKEFIVKYRIYYILNYISKHDCFLYADGVKL